MNVFSVLLNARIPKIKVITVTMMLICKSLIEIELTPRKIFLNDSTIAVIGLIIISILYFIDDDFKLIFLEYINIFKLSVFFLIYYYIRKKLI